MRNGKRTPILLALAGMLASLVTFVSSGTAAAADSMPETKWNPVSVNDTSDYVTDLSGGLTVSCQHNGGGSNLVTYSATGQVVRNISRTSTIDGVTNCITNPAVDKNGILYGVPYGKKSNGSYDNGANLLAYSGNTLLWKYPVNACGDTKVTIGADGNIYTKKYVAGDGMYLIGLSPTLAPGQTQPTKVFEVKTTLGCSLKPTAYKDGILVRGEQTQYGNPDYYSYTGKYLGKATVGNYQDERLNLEGELFVPKMSGTFNSDHQSWDNASISKYDPLTGRVAWTSRVNTTGAPALSPLMATFEGGVVAYVKERKLVAGVPVTPTEWVKKFVTLNRNGQLLSSITLPTQDPAGNSFVDETPRFNVDGSGKLAAMRNLVVSTGISSPAQYGVVTLDIYDVTSGTRTYQGAMRDEPNGAGNSYGYYASLKPHLGNGVMFQVAKCSQNCTVSGPRLFPIKMTGMSLDYPRGAILAASAPTQPTPRSYVAMGDSYSSGEGVEPFEAGTNVTGGNQCHRSVSAYARFIDRNPKLSASLPATGGFVACSGARTNEILNSNTPNQEASQYSNLNANTKLVTITIGGNDIGFTDFGVACVNPATNCRVGSSAHTTAKNKIDNELPAKLENVYANVLGFAPNAEIYVLGYPQVAPEKSSTEPNDVRCSYLYDSGYDSTGTIPMNWGDAQAARDIVTRLDNKIEAAVAAAGSSRLHYVDVNEAGSPFEGHTMCADPGESFFNNIDQAVGHPAYALHPNQRGQEAYAELAIREMAAVDPSTQVNDGAIDPGGCGNPDFC